MGDVIDLQAFKDRKSAPKPVEKSDFQKQQEKVIASIKNVNELLKDLKLNPNNK